AAGRRAAVVPPIRRTGSAFALLLLSIAVVRAPGRRRLAAALPAAWLGALIACGGNTTSPPVNNGPGSGSASASLSPTTLTFASQALQSASGPQTVTLTSGSGTALTISSVSASGDFSQTNTCGASIAAGASCSIAVTFTPTAAGQRTGTLAVADNAANSPQIVTLTGTGANAAGGTPSGTYQVTVTGASGSLS